MKGFNDLEKNECIKKIVKEIELLSRGKTSLQMMMYTIMKREDIMTQIDKINITPCKLDSKEVIAVLLDKLRRVTLIVIEFIIEVRSEFKALNQPNVLILYKNQNYIIKIANDTKDIIEVRVGEAFKYMKRLDVFFLSISQPTLFLPNKYLRLESKLTLPMPVGELYRRMKRAEAYFLNELNNFNTKPEHINSQLEENKAQDLKSSIYVNINTAIEDKGHLRMKSSINDRTSLDIPNDIMEKQIEANLCLKPMKLKESEAKDFLEKYTKELPLNIRNSYPRAQTLLMRIHNSADNYWLASHNNTALAIFCLEHIHEQVRAVILHASSIKKEEFDTMLFQLKEHIWANTSADEIRVELLYIQEDNKFTPCKELENKYFASGFKWKTILNTPNKYYSRRTLILGIQRPYPKGEHKKSIQFMHCSILGLNDKSGMEESINVKYLFNSGCSLIKALLCLLEEDNLCDIKDGYISNAIELAKKIKEGYELYSTKSVSGIESILETLKNLEIDKTNILLNDQLVFFLIIYRLCVEYRVLLYIY